MSPHLNAAAVTTDPIERMKPVMTASISFLYPCHSWGKPLNPILGETYQAYLPDGSLVSVEQVCHHPPVSYIIVDGP
jgi:Oxysterol-binding protein